MKLIIRTQKIYFREEYDVSTHKTQIYKRDSILSLNPILQPYSSPISKFLTQFTHLVKQNGRNQLVLQLLRTEFWILKLKVLVKTTMYVPCICLEPVSDLTKQAFLAAFTRFFSRRACPANLYSDNRTNFLGAEVTTLHSHQYIPRHFSQPGTPHMGALRESGEKVSKPFNKKSHK